MLVGFYFSAIICKRNIRQKLNHIKDLNIYTESAGIHGSYTFGGDNCEYFDLAGN